MSTPIEVAQAAGSGASGGTAARRFTPLQLLRAAIGAAFLATSVGYLAMARGLAVGDLTSPGPGFWPSFIGVAAIVVSVVTILEALFKPHPNETGDIEMPIGPDRRRTVLFGALLLGFVVALPLLGFYVSTLTVVFGIMRMLSPATWWKLLLSAVALVSLVYFAFTTFFFTRFPAGILLEGLVIA